MFTEVVEETVLEEVFGNLLEDRETLEVEAEFGEEDFSYNEIGCLDPFLQYE